VSKRSECA